MSTAIPVCNQIDFTGIVEISDFSPPVSWLGNKELIADVKRMLNRPFTQSHDSWNQTIGKMELTDTNPKLSNPIQQQAILPYPKTSYPTLPNNKLSNPIQQQAIQPYLTTSNPTLSNNKLSYPTQQQAIQPYP